VGGGKVPGTRWEPAEARGFGDGFAFDDGRRRSSHCGSSRAPSSSAGPPPRGGLRPLPPGPAGGRSRRPRSASAGTRSGAGCAPSPWRSAASRTWKWRAPRSTHRREDLRRNAETSVGEDLGSRVRSRSAPAQGSRPPGRRASRVRPGGVPTTPRHPCHWPARAARRDSRPKQRRVAPTRRHTRPARPPAGQVTAPRLRRPPTRPMRRRTSGSDRDTPRSLSRRRHPRGSRSRRRSPDAQRQPDLTSLMGQAQRLLQAIGLGLDRVQHRYLDLPPSTRRAPAGGSARPGRSGRRPRRPRHRRAGAPSSPGWPPPSGPHRRRRGRPQPRVAR
jgi:hypothetical protein